VKSACVILLSVFLWSSVGVVQGKSAQIPFADGKPWKMTASETKGGNITFNPDGTGLMGTGFFSMKLTWVQKAEFTCINFGSMGEHCVKFLPVAGGFDGDEQDGKRQISLRRN
jgi:hypothetical protein